MTTRTIVALWMALSLVGCTSMQPVKDFTPQNAREQLEVGDEVRIVTTAGTIYELEVTRVGDDSFSGKAENGKHYKVPYAAVQSIKTEQVSAGKTLGTTGGVLLVLGILGAIIFVEAMEDFADALGCMFGCED